MRQAGPGKAICLHVCRSLGVVKATRISGDSGAPCPVAYLSLPRTCTNTRTLLVYSHI